MVRNTIFFGALLAVGVSSLVSASELEASNVMTVSSAVTSESVVLGLGKSLVIDLKEDAADAFVGNPKAVMLTMRTSRRAYLTGGEIGQSNVFFYAKDGRQIGGLDISVSSAGELQPPPLRNHAITGTSIDIYRGATDMVSVYCSAMKCSVPPEKAPPENLTVINSTYSSGSGTFRSSGSSTSTAASVRRAESSPR